jgi:hypothetical protein
MQRPCRPFRIASELVASLVMLAATSVAQTPTATITGTVLDTSSGAIPDATVTVVNQATNVRSIKKTAADGTFTILNLLPGQYVLTVEKEGFKKAALPPFTLNVNQTLTQTVTLAVGSTTETVTVSVDAVEVMVQRSSTELGTTIDDVMVHDLPMNGRNFSELLILQPGVNPMDTSQGNSSGRTNAGGADGGNIAIPGSTIFKVSVNGQGNRSNAYYMDGIVNTDDRGGGWSVPPIADTIQELKVQSHNNDVQYGNVLGAVVNIVTKSGTNSFHGSAWEFARNAIFDARNPFTGFCTTAVCPTLASNLSSQVTAGTQTAAGAAAILSGTPVSPIGYSQHEFGGTVGGPIIKNKTFFYAAYEGWRYSVPTNSFVIDPTPEELSGDFTGKISPELIGSVNSARTGVTPNTIYNPFAESGSNSAVPFSCDPTGNPMPLLNPGAAFGTMGYGIQVTGGTPCNKLPSGLIDQKLVKVVQAYTASQAKNCAFTPNYVSAVYNCLDSRNTINNANNFDFRVDHHFSEKNTVFARAYMMWNDNNGIVAGTSSITPSPFHVWNIGGAWDHIFTPNLVLSVRGGINSRPATVNPTNPQGFQPQSAAGYNNLEQTGGFFLNVGGYIGSANSGIGNVGPQLRANPEHNINASLTWIHGKHNLSFGGSWLYEDRTEINTYETFVSSTTQTCPTNASGTFACSANQGNALASMLLDVPSALTVTLPTYSNPHVIMQPFGFFAQDEWHVRPNLTVTLGLRYDYNPAVNLAVSNGQTINALDLPGQRYIIGAKQTDAYTSGCGSPPTPPCVPGGLNPNNPAFTVTAGGVTYNTVNNIVFSNSQPALKAIKDNIGPRIGIAWGFAPKTVLRMGYGIFYDPIAYRSQYAENTIQGSIWPWTRGVSATLNTAPLGTAPTPTVNPICSSAGACGPYGGYGTSYLPSLVGTNPIIVAPTPWGSTFGGYTNAPDYTDPRSQQWNFQIERQLTATSMASIGYVGSHTQRLDWCCRANYPQGGPFCQNNPAQGFTCSTTPLTPAQIVAREYLPFAAQGWNYSESVGFSTFHALEAQYQQRLSHGLETLVAFTWEKCLADTNGDFGAENGSEGNPVQYYFAPRLAKGVCSFDIPKIFTVTAIYQLPFGRGMHHLTKGVLSHVLGNWQTSYTFLARSGKAFNPTWGGASNICASPTATGCVPVTVAGLAPNSNDPANLSNAGGSITGYSRPSILGDCNLIPAKQTVGQWYNPSCFVSPASPAVGPGYGFGNAPVGGMRSMGFWNLDVALVKNVYLTETKQLQFRAEGYNVLNHMVLDVPGTSIAPSYSGGTVSYGTAGVVSNIANFPRSLQLALKFMF